MKKRVVIYARVSTEHEAQISALENQVQYYDEILKRHPDWELVDRYIDEGITGTSIHKRESFLRMMQDAKDKKFDLIITREVSRFARNIVDTLQQTRLLRTYGVEVWFTEDNIWTLNDEDGELRLSIMATLAQNESKKISQRVKAGQMISFKNGVLYGNGNILGYNRVGDRMVVDEEQAATVKRIFELYLQGNGIRKIQDIMEQEGRRTASGLTTWQAGNIDRVLKNPFYCGRIEYRKQYVPDYLTQKKINNHGEIEKVYVQGTHEILVSEEDFDKVQSIFAERRIRKDSVEKNFGKPMAQNVWVRKTRCTCDHAMNRRSTYTASNGEKSYMFQCYHQLRTGTPKAREKKGLSLEGVCDNATFPEWKLYVQAEFLFKRLVRNKQAIYDKAIEMLGAIDTVQNTQAEDVNRIAGNIKEIDKLKGKIAVLLDLCMEGDISKEMFREKKQKLENQILQLEEKNTECRQSIAENEKQVDEAKDMERLESFIKMKAFRENAKIPSTVIDYCVERIVFDKGQFLWFLNTKLGCKCTEIAIDGSSLKKTANPTCQVHSPTGSYQQRTVINEPICLGTYEIPKSYVLSNIGLYYDENEFHIPEKLVIELCLV